LQPIGDIGTYFAPKNVNSESQIIADLPNWTKIDPKQLIALYPNNNGNFSSPYGSGTGSGSGQNGPTFKRESSILGDIIMLAPARQFLSRAADKGTKVYGYLFSDSGGSNYLGPGSESTFLTHSGAQLVILIYFQYRMARIFLLCFHRALGLGLRVVRLVRLPAS
jgi:hypothetical protein